MTSSDPHLEIVQVSRILAGTGLLDAFGHASQRHADRPDRFWMSRNKAPAMVERGGKRLECLDYVSDVDAGTDMH